MGEMRYAAVLFIILAALFLFVFLVAREPAPDDSTEIHTDMQIDEQQTDPAKVLANFLAVIEKNQPLYSDVAVPCPVCETELAVPRQQSNNRFGGVSTDLMSIALGLQGEYDRPSMEAQDWEMFLATCPECYATYHIIDISNLLGGRYSIEGFDVESLAPTLAGKSIDDLTVDERIYLRVLTMHTAGIEDVELGFAALQGAYAANFGTWYGNIVTIPSTAFYALAASYFDSALKADEAGPPGAQIITALTMGECLRLLGRDTDAEAAFALVHELAADVLDADAPRDAATLDALSQMEALLAAGDHTLHRANIAGFAEPPLGWYIEEMLPAINSHIAEHRATWNSLEDVSAVYAAIQEAL